jgi:hypothetical protein
MTSVNGEGRRARVAAVVDGVLHEITQPLPLLARGADPMVYESEAIRAHLAGHVRAESPGFTVDLVWEPLRAAADYTGGETLPSIEGTEPLQHFQRSAVVRGRISTERGEREIEGVGVRDRTWGRRDEAQSWLEFYACFLVFDDFDVATMKYRSPHHGDRIDGYLPGLERSVRQAHAVRNAAADLRGLDLTLDDGSELTVRVVGSPPARMPLHVGPDDGKVPNFGCYDEVVVVEAGDGSIGIGTFQQGYILGLD